MIDPTQVILDLQEMRDNGHLSDALLRRAIRSIAEADERCSWVGTYLFNGEANELWLHNYVGSPTEFAKVPVGEGVCGTAVAEKQNQNVADVSQFEKYLESSLDVKSEMVVLIRAGDDIFGLIDMESDAESAFSDEDLTAIGALADKLAEQLAAERR